MATIEEQLKIVDRVTKECEVSRKTLDLLLKRVDEVNDEVKHYREFLTRERARRDPNQYKKSSASSVATGGMNDSEKMASRSRNEKVCSTLTDLTGQLTQEWFDKLKVINELHTKFSLPSPGSPKHESNH